MHSLGGSTYQTVTSTWERKFQERKYHRWNHCVD